MKCAPFIIPAMMMLSPAYAESSPSEAMSTAFNIAPVYWDKNIAVVDVSGGAVAGADDILQWPETTGELLKLMDALKYEYETRCFQCVVFSLDANAEQKALNALVECVTVCDMLRIPMRIVIQKAGEWVEIAPTYTTTTASHLMLAEDGSLYLYSAENVLQHTAGSVAEVETVLKSTAEQGEVVNLFWKPEAATYARFIELVELCNRLNVEYALMIQP